MYPFSLMNTSSMQLSGVEVGVHYYWNIGGVSVHGQVFIVIWFVIALLLGAALAGTSSTNSKRLAKLYGVSTRIYTRHREKSTW